MIINFSGACDQAINRHIAVGASDNEMTKQLRGQLYG